MVINRSSNSIVQMSGESTPPWGVPQVCLMEIVIEFSLAVVILFRR